MEGFELAKLKDELLVYGIERAIEGFVTPTYFVLELGSEDPVYNHYVIRACEEIVDYGNNIVFSFESKDKFQCSEITRKFLDEGGFSKLYKEQSLVEKRKVEIENLQHENLRLTNSLNRQRLKTHFIPILISIISLVFAAYSLFKPSNGVSEEQYDTKIESIEKDIRQLRIEFKNENDELKDRLYKAEMLIAVYEDNEQIKN